MQHWSKQLSKQQQGDTPQIKSKSCVMKKDCRNANRNLILHKIWTQTLHKILTKTLGCTITNCTTGNLVQVSGILVDIVFLTLGIQIIAPAVSGYTQEAVVHRDCIDQVKKGQNHLCTLLNIQWLFKTSSVDHSVLQLWFNSNYLLICHNYWFTCFRLSVSEKVAQCK